MMWLRSNGFRALALGLLAAAIVGVPIIKRSGTPSYQTAEIVRFGSYANEFGEQPIVVVVTKDGRQSEIMTAPPLLAFCTIGSRIRIITRPHSMTVAPEGCQRSSSPR